MQVQIKAFLKDDGTILILDQEKKQKMWIWIAIDRYTQEALGFSVGSRARKAYKKLV